MHRPVLREPSIAARESRDSRGCGDGECIGGTLERKQDKTAGVRKRCLGTSRSVTQRSSRGTQSGR